MAMSKSTNVAATLLGAAGGALALYLLDPKSGQERRDHLRSIAEEAIGSARQRIEALASEAGEQAMRAGGVAASKVSDAVRPFQEAANSHIADATGVASDARSAVSRVIAETQSALDELRHRGRNAVSALRGEEPSTGALSLTLTAAGCCAAGVGLMWLLDPDRGRARRAQVGQQAHHILNQTSRAFHGTGRHLRNKLTGVAAVAERNLNERMAPR
jgi:gas vesicle protein